MDRKAEIAAIHKQLVDTFGSDVRLVKVTDTIEPFDHPLADDLWRRAVFGRPPANNGSCPIGPACPCEWCHMPGMIECGACLAAARSENEGKGEKS